MSDPNVTVLMSVYNGQRYLNQAIDSILDQSFRDFEFLIINDGSTDKTKEILESYNDPRLKIITNKINVGLTRSLNKGLRYARGRYIARMDADDISMKNRLELQVDFLERHNHIGLVFSMIEVIDQNGRMIGWSDEYLSPEKVFYYLCFRNCVCHSTVLFRKDLVVGLGGYDEQLPRTQDYELWTRLSGKTKLFQLDLTLGKWRDTNFNVSSRYFSEQTDSARKISRQIIEDTVGHEITEAEQLMLRDLNLERSPVDDVGIFIRILDIFDRFNENFLNNRKQTIQALGLDKETVQHTMKAKRDKYMSLYFKKQPFQKSMTDFFRLPLKRKFAVVNLGLKVFFRRIKGACKRVRIFNK